LLDRDVSRPSGDVSRARGDHLRRGQQEKDGRNNRSGALRLEPLSMTSVASMTMAGKGGFPMPVDELKAWCQAQATDLIAWRRRFHAHPELSFQEQETAAYIRRYLEYLGSTWSNPSGHSTVAVIPGNRPGPTVAFRADIDALPIEEQNDVPYR